MKKRYSEEQIIKAIKEHEAGAKVSSMNFSDFVGSCACKATFITINFTQSLKPKQKPSLFSLHTCLSKY